MPRQIKQKETISLTFGDQGENHVGMEKIGNMVNEGDGFNYDDFVKYKKIFNDNGYEVKIYELNKLYSKDEYYLENIKNKTTVDKAYIMVIRNGINFFLDDGKTSQDVYDEMNKFEWDAKYYDVRRGKILNKHARTNVCFGDTSSEPNYENKQGRIVGYPQVPNLDSLRKNMKKKLGDKFKNLICEGNRYYDLNKCGIGWHGDSERRKVVAFRLGHSMNLNYKWFHKSCPFGKTLTLKLNDGDMYIMSEKAVGTDWKKKNICTLRHSAGIKGSKYTDI